MVGSLPRSLARSLPRQRYMQINFCQAEADAWLMLGEGLRKISAERHATYFEKSRVVSGRAREKLKWNGVAAWHSRQLLNCGSIN